MSATSTRARTTPRSVWREEAPKPDRKFEFGALVSVKGYEKYRELNNSNGKVAGYEWGGNNWKLGSKDTWFYYIRPAESRQGSPGAWIAEDQLGQIT